ncbi:MAG: HAD family hydrolase [Candidatus Hydrogenedentes bacterium]|nr:HAD family hydrolase [Candidatus Hydrogenedentota bacterium]
MAIRAVLFDLDDTLIEEEGPLLAAFRAACAPVEERHGIPLMDFVNRARVLGRASFQCAPAIDYLRAIDAGTSDLLTSEYDRRGPHAEAMDAWLEIYRREYFLNALREFGVEDAPLARDMIRRFHENRHAHHRVFPEAREVLATLAARLPLVLVTNGPGDHQRRKLEAVDLASYFAGVIVSGEVGISKPSPHMFKAALKAAGTSASEAIMVGNNLPRDIGGAQESGIRGAWVNRAREEANGVRPDWDISDLRQVLAILDR